MIHKEDYFTKVTVTFELPHLKRHTVLYVKWMRRYDSVLLVREIKFSCVRASTTAYIYLLKPIRNRKIIAAHVAYTHHAFRPNSPASFSLRPCPPQLNRERCSDPAV